MRNTIVNGFWAESGHMGTHTDKFFLELGEAVKGLKSKPQMEKMMQELKQRIQNDEFMN